MSASLHGIHHVTAIAGDPQENVNFYCGILGLRLVKKTVNFDDPYTYHLYYGDETGHPGTLITFFPWSAQALRGRRGVGQIAAFSFSIPADAMSFWMDRLKHHKIEIDKPSIRFGEEVIGGVDRDGFPFELVASAHDDRQGWGSELVPARYALRGLHSVTVFESGFEPTVMFLNDSLGFKEATAEGPRRRFAIGGGGAGAVVDIVHRLDLSRGTMGAGIVHHVAWRTDSDAAQVEIRKRLVDSGLNVTPVIDRKYFHSIYFHEPGGVLFEVATDEPGFLVDETAKDLGKNLKLPAEHEYLRTDLERSLPPLALPSA